MNAPEPREAGNPRLRQVRTFIEQAESVQPDVMQMLLGALRGRLVLGAILGSLLGLVIGVLIFLAVNPVFQSSGMMRIIARESKILYNDADDSRVRLFESFAAAETNYLSSRPVLERALSKLHAQDLPDVPSDISKLATMLTIEGKKGLITIAAKNESAALAAAAVNGVVDAYTELRLEQTEGQQNFRVQELAAREKALLTQLEAIDKTVLDVGKEYGQVAIAEAHKNKIAQIGEISGRIDELTTTLNQLETVGYNLDADAGDAEIRRTMLLDQSMANMTYDRAKRAAEVVSLAKRYRAGHPKVEAMNAEILVLDKAIDERRMQIATLGRTGALTQRDQSEKQSVDELRNLLSKLQDRRASLEGEAIDLNARMVRLAYLKEERGQTRANLDQTRGALEEVRVESRNASPGVTEIVARGGVPDRPYEDKRKAMAMVGFMGGLGIGFALIALLGLLRPTIRSEKDIASLGASVASAGAFTSAEDPVHSLRNMLHLALSRHDSSRGRILAVIGAGKEQGVTTLARALAHSFHQSGSRTALVDGHLVKPDISTMYAGAHDKGLTDWIFGSRTDPLPVMRDGGITLLPAGYSPEIRDHSISPRDVRHAMEMLAEDHDIVITDCGVAKQVLSSALFTAHCDAVLLVLRRGISQAEARSAAAAVLATSRKQVLVVLTGEPDAAIPAWMMNVINAGLRPISATALKLKQQLMKRKG
jgi:polysaccharide biosynthesis transport protein